MKSLGLFDVPEHEIVQIAEGVRSLISAGGYTGLAQQGIEKLNH